MHKIGQHVDGPGQRQGVTEHFVDGNLAWLLWFNSELPQVMFLLLFSMVVLGFEKKSCCGTNFMDYSKCVVLALRRCT